MRTRPCFTIRGGSSGGHGRWRRNSNRLIEKEDIIRKILDLWDVKPRPAPICPKRIPSTPSSGSIVHTRMMPLPISSFITSIQNSRYVLEAELAITPHFPIQAAVRLELLIARLKHHPCAFHCDTHDSGGRNRFPNSLLYGLQQSLRPKKPSPANAYNAISLALKGPRFASATGSAPHSWQQDFSSKICPFCARHVIFSKRLEHEKPGFENLCKRAAMSSLSSRFLAWPEKPDNCCIGPSRPSSIGMWSWPGRIPVEDDEMASPYEQICR
jgi:hypothetical protein